jgi:hypothetical protein
MTDAGYVLSGWVVTGAALGGYLARLWVRARRAKSHEHSAEGADGWR